MSEELDLDPVYKTGEKSPYGDLQQNEAIVKSWPSNAEPYHNGFRMYDYLIHQVGGEDAARVLRRARRRGYLFIATRDVQVICGTTIKIRVEEDLCRMDLNWHDPTKVVW